MIFTRRINTNDTSDDISLSTPRFFIYGYGGPANVARRTIGYHPSTPVVSNERITLGTTAECGTEGFTGQFLKVYY